MLFDQTSEISAQTAAVSRKRQPPLILQATAMHAGLRQIGLLPYSSAGNAVLPHHIPYGSDITGGIRHAREKKTGGKKSAKHWEEVSTKFSKNTKLQQLPLKEPQKVQSVLTPSSTTNYTPHPSLSIENPQRSSFFRC